MYVWGVAGQLAKRLGDAGGRRGRTLTLKLMRRKAGAPEPPKFLGHGICDNMSRSVTLPRFVGGAAEIAAAAQELLRALRVPPPDIRGVGLQVRVS